MTIGWIVFVRQMDWLVRTLVSFITATQSWGMTFTKCLKAGVAKSTQHLRWLITTNARITGASKVKANYGNKFMRNEQKQSEAKEHPVDTLVMLRELTTKDVESFEFIEITPARGKAYYSSDLDVAVIDYGDYMRVYYNRVIDHGKTASSFNKSIINRTT